MIWIDLRVLSNVRTMDNPISLALACFMDKFKNLSPAKVAVIVGALFILPVLWIIEVEGVTTTTTMDLMTGQTSSSSNFLVQFAKAGFFGMITFGCFVAAKVMENNKTPWPPAVQQQLERRGLASPGGPQSWGDQPDTTYPHQGYPSQGYPDAPNPDAPSPDAPHPDTPTTPSGS